MRSTLAFWLDSPIICDPLSHSGLILIYTVLDSHFGSILVSNVLHSRILARLLYQICPTLALWPDFNENQQIHIKLKIASVCSPDLQPPSIQPASSQHPAGIQPASSQHPASIQPASNQHPASIKPASSQHPASIQPCITSSVTQASEPNR
jgi:hypothetical protein